MSGSDRSNVDRGWMNLNDRFCKQYKEGVLSFLEVAKKVVNERGMVRCPCIRCLNTVFATLRDIREHLHVHGMCKGYTRWTYHGENLGQCSTSTHNAQSMSENENENENSNDDDDDDDDDDDEIMDVLNDMQGGAFHDFGMRNRENQSEGAKNVNKMDCDSEFSHLFGEAQKELYTGCRRFSSLTFLVKLLHIKVLNGWSNKSFDMLLELLKEAFPRETVLPESYYASKKLLRGLGLVAWTRVVGVNASKFITEVGILVRRLVPPTHGFWCDVPQEIIDDIRYRLADQFNLDLENQLHRDVMDSQMMVVAKEYRYELRRYYLQKVEEHGLQEGRLQKHPRVQREEDWETLTRKWESQEYKDLAKENSLSRAQMPYMHKGGSKSNATKHHEMLQDDPNTTWVDVFEKQHSYGPEKWINDLAKKQHAQMVEYMNPPSIPENENGSETIESRPPPLCDVDAMEKVLGATSGYRKGMGRGPKPPRRSRASTNSYGPSQSEIETKKKLEETIHDMEQMKESLTQQQELTRTLQEQMSQFMSMWQASQGGGNIQSSGARNENENESGSESGS